MLRLTVLDVVGGLRSNHFFPEGELRDLDPESFMVLDSSLLLLPPGAADLFLIQRQSTSRGFVSWLGLYRSLPPSLSHRPGDYCGAGLWLVDEILDGEAAIGLLRSVLNQIYRLMRGATRQQWDLKRLQPADLIGDVDTLARRLRAHPSGAEIGRESICLDLSGSGDKLALQRCVGEVLGGEDDRYDRFGRVLLADDEAVAAAVRKSGRIPIARPSEVERVRLRSPDARQPGGQRGAEPKPRSPLASARRDSSPPAAQAATPGAADLWALQRDLRALETKVAQLSGELVRLERGIRRRPEARAARERRRRGGGGVGRLARHLRPRRSYRSESADADHGPLRKPSPSKSPEVRSTPPEPGPDRPEGPPADRDGLTLSDIPPSGSSRPRDCSN